MPLPRNKPAPKTTPGSGPGGAGTPAPVPVLVALPTADYNALIQRIQKLETYISALAQTYEIRNETGLVVAFN